MLANTEVKAYLQSVRRRLRFAITARGVAFVCIAALTLTIASVLLANSLRFSDGAVIFSRSLLLAATIAVIVVFLVRPLRKRLSDERLARFVEEKNPSLQDRLVTAVELEEKSKSDPSARLFGEILSKDVLSRTAAVPVEALIESRKISRPFVWAGLSVAILFSLSLFGPGFFQYGSKLLWLGWAKEKSDPLYQLNVVPGDVVIGRNTDQEITESPVGFLPEGVRIHVLNQGSANWESASMLPEEKGGNFRFLLMNVKDSLEYYAESNGVLSRHHKVSVIDVPHVQRLEVHYHYPDYSGMKDAMESPGGDIVALKGTAVTIVAHTDIAASGGRMVIDDGTSIDMTQSGDKELRATFSLTKDALYHLRLQDHQKREAKASDEYVIQALTDAPPTLKIDRPGHDMQPSPIEEVVIGMNAQDDVRMKALELHYSVNGTPEKTVTLGTGGNQELNGSHTIALEDYKMVPGDLVSFYGVAKDADSNVTKSDMFFLQVRPFERNYTQSQASGGGGGGQQGQDNTFLSEKEKQIIAATWNVIRRKTQQTPEQLSAQAKALTEIQQTLQEQAQTMASRTEGRELTQVNDEFQSLAENLKEAAKSMGDASKLLEKQGFETALTPEQTALQHLLRAESTYRDIQVAMGGGGGGGGGGAAQDLSELFALELDTGKNQYESLQQMGEKNSNASMEELMRKLEELARRQENLTHQEQQKESMRAANRWEQEMLRREAEELQKRMEELAKQNNSSQLSQATNRLQQAVRDMQEASRKSGQQSGQQSQSGQQGGQQSNQAGQQGQQSRQQQGQGAQSGQQGMNEEMQQTRGGQSERARAAQRLREASSMISGAQQQSNEEAMNRLAERAQELAKQQQEIAQDIRRQAGSKQQGSSGEEGDKQGQRGNGRTPTASERETLERTIDNKVEQLDALNQFKQQVGETAARMAATQRKTAQRLREAMSMIQDERLEDKIRQGAYMEQRGMWPLASPAEENLAEDMQKLAQRMKEAKDSFGGEKGDDKLQQALTTAERIRQGLEGLGQQQRDSSGQQKSSGRDGQQNGSGREGQRLSRNGSQGDESGNKQGMGSQAGTQSGQQGQQGSQSGQSGQQGSHSGQSGQQGSQSGQSGGQGQSQSGGQGNGTQASMGQGMGQGSMGQGMMRGGQSSGTGAGAYQPGVYGQSGGIGRPLTQEEARAMDQEFQELLRQATTLPSMVSDDPSFSKMAKDLAAGMRNMDPREFVDEEGNRKAQSLIDQWKEMELRLSRKIQGDQADPVKLAGQERVPEKYRGILEEYYRSLSKSAK